MTRSYILTWRLAPGSSGVWVVDEYALIGIITAVYDDEPFAHITPIGTVFAGVQAVCADHFKHPTIRVLDRNWNIPSATSDVARASRGNDKPTREHSSPGKDLEIAAPQRTVIKTRLSSRNIEYGLLLPMLIMSIAIALVSLAKKPKPRIVH
jgi:hypothetical protein